MLLSGTKPNGLHICIANYTTDRDVQTSSTKKKVSEIEQDGHIERKMMKNYVMNG